MSHSFGESYRVGSASGDLAVKVFCAWDYKVIQARSVRLQSENICTHLKVSTEQGHSGCKIGFLEVKHLQLLLQYTTDHKYEVTLANHFAHYATMLIPLQTNCSF